MGNEKALVEGLKSGILSLSVYVGAILGLICTIKGVPVMDLNTMIEWCGGVLRVPKDSVIAQMLYTMLPIVPEGSSPLPAPHIILASR